MSTISQFITAIAAGGGVKTRQRGYIDATTSTGTGRDLSYKDVTISAVGDIGKCLCVFEGGFGSTSAGGLVYSATVSKAECRLTSTTNLRISGSAGGSWVTGVWHVVELN